MVEATDDDHLTEENSVQVEQLGTSGHKENSLHVKWSSEDTQLLRTYFKQFIYLRNTGNLPITTSSVTFQTRDRNCSSLSATAAPAHWFVGGVAFQSNNVLFEMRKYNARNISLLIETFQRETDGTIVTCKVEEPLEEEWAIKILYPSSVCIHKLPIQGEPMTADETCNFTHGNPNVTVILVTAPSCPRVSKQKVDIPLCEAVNRADLGARQFVGNATGLFKMEVLYSASIREYYIEDIHTNVWNVTPNDIRYIRFNCYGVGNPHPVMTLMKDEKVVLSTTTSFQHKMQFTESDNLGIYTCIASNALGSDNKSINVNPQKIDSHREDLSKITNIIVYVVSGVVALALVSFVVQRLSRMVSCCRPLRPTETVSLPLEMVSRPTLEQTAVTLQTTEEVPARRTGSVHLYESIPPSPIADISFFDADVAVDNDFDAHREVQIADSGRYESLDRSTREDVTLTQIYRSNRYTREDVTHYINLQI